MSDPSAAIEDDHGVTESSTDPTTAQNPNSVGSAETEAGPSADSGWFAERWWLAAAAIATGGSGALLGVAALVISTPIDPGQGTVLGGLGVLAAGGITYYGTHRTRLSNERIALATTTQADAELAHERKKLITTNDRDDIKAKRTETREQERALRTRFTASAAQLADSSPTIRLAGVFSLSSLANDWYDFGSIDEKNVCMELLRAYIVSPQIQPLPDSDEAPPFLQVRARIVRVLHAEQARLTPTDRRRVDASSGSLLAFARLDNVDLTGADLDAVDLTGASLTEANLTGATLTNAILSDANLTGATLTDANLTAAYFFRTNLVGANLTDANLTAAELPIAKLIDTNLAGANLRRAKFTTADLSGATLVGVDLTGAKLVRTDFSRANLTHADLTEAVLGLSILTDADFSYANLTRARFSGTSWNGANFTNANFTEAIGFDS